MPDKSLPTARIFDAYFLDEYGVVNTASNTSVDVSDRVGLSKNRFTTIAMSGSTVSETFQSGRFDLSNRADPNSNSALNPRAPDYVRNPIDAGFEGLTHSGDFGFGYYFSDATRTYGSSLNGAPWDSGKPVAISLLFGPRNILCRSGVRTFFEKTSRFSGIIQVPGVEPKYFANARGEPNKGRWGVSMTDTDIAKVLKDFFGVPVPYKVAVLAAYSTGTNGLNQTILNRIINLANVQRVIFFDCLYELSSGSTVNALKRIKSANSNVQIIIYWASVSDQSNSVSADMTQLKVVDALKPMITYSQNVIKLAGDRFYRGLTCSRIVNAGRRDGLINLSPAAEAALNDLIAVTPARGTLVSDAAKYTSFVGSLPSSATRLDSWSSTNKAKFDAFYKFLDSNSGGSSPLINQISNNQLLGWRSAGGETHDLLIPEFGWEFLVG
jgi:hypothetical protein